VAACEAAGFPYLVGAAKACLAWLAWQDEDLKTVVALGNEAAELSRSAVGPYTFLKWVYLWPLIAMSLADGQVSEAVAAGRQMLEPSQQRLPVELEQTLDAACAAWDRGDSETARAKLATSLELAHELHYF
jgi:hypothetical protein